MENLVSYIYLHETKMEFLNSCKGIFMITLYKQWLIIWVNPVMSDDQL